MQVGIGTIVNGGTLYAFCADGSNSAKVQMRASLANQEQYETFIDYEGYNGRSGIATVTVKKYPVTGSTTPDWTETHTLDAGAGDPLPSGITSNNEHRKAWCGMVNTPNGVSLDAHVNYTECVLYPTSA